MIIQMTDVKQWKSWKRCWSWI